MPMSASPQASHSKGNHMPPYNDYTWAEIQSQPQAWGATLAYLEGQAPTVRAWLNANR